MLLMKKVFYLALVHYERTLSEIVKKTGERNQISWFLFYRVFFSGKICCKTQNCCKFSFKEYVRNSQWPVVCQPATTACLVKQACCQVGDTTVATMIMIMSSLNKQTDQACAHVPNASPRQPSRKAWPEPWWQLPRDMPWDLKPCVREYFENSITLIFSMGFFLNHKTYTYTRVKCDAS